VLCTLSAKGVDKPFWLGRAGGEEKGGGERKLNKTTFVPPLKRPGPAKADLAGAYIPIASLAFGGRTKTRP